MDPRKENTTKSGITIVGDTAALSYGAQYVEDYEKYKDPNRLRIWNVIKKGDKLPASNTSLSTCKEDGQTGTWIAIFEGNNEYEYNHPYLPSLATEIGSVTISGLENTKRVT